MDDPARRARPVGPPPPGSPPGSPPGTPPPWPPGPTGSGAPPPRMRVYSWSSSGPSIPWFAILLVALGVGLLIEGFTDLSFGSIVILAVGLLLGAAWLVRGVVGATVPALVLTAWGLAGIGLDLGLLSGDGWRPFLIGIAFLVAWGLARYQDARREWALFVGAILAVVGLAGISDALPDGVDLGAAIAVAMIAIGGYLIFRTRLPGRA